MNKLAKGLLAAAAALTLTATAVAPAQAAAPEPHVYAALGDSFAAGVGTQNSSVQAYPYALGRKLNKGTLDKVSFLAASGAGTQTVYLTQVEGIPVSAEVITVTVGGNDGGAFFAVGACLLALTDGDPATDPTLPCALVQGAIADAQDPADSTAELAQTAGIVGLLRAIQAQSPGATIFVTGYPRLFDANGTFPLRTCPALGLLNTPQYVALLDGIDLATSTLNGRIATAVGVSGVNAVYVDVTDDFADHGLCDGTDSWINGPGKRAPLHPTVAGQQAYAKAIAEEGFLITAAKH